MYDPRGFLVILVCGLACWCCPIYAANPTDDLIVLVRDEQLVNDVRELVSFDLQANDDGDGQGSYRLDLLCDNPPPVIHGKLGDAIGKAAFILEISVSHDAATFLGKGWVVNKRLIQMDNYVALYQTVDPRVAKHYRVTSEVAVTLYDGRLGNSVLSEKQRLTSKVHQFADGPDQNELRKQLNERALQFACDILEQAVTSELAKSLRYRIDHDTIVAQFRLGNRFPSSLSAKLSLTHENRTVAEQKVSLDAAECRQVDVVVARNVDPGKRRDVLAEAKVELQPHILDVQLRQGNP